MNENEKTPEVREEASPKQDPTIAELAKALKETKANSVSKEDYAALEKKNSELMKAIIDGSQIGVKSEAPEKPTDLRQLANSLCEGGIGNLEYAKRATKFRDEYMKKYEKDPFAPNNDKMTADDLDKAQTVADVLKDCIEQADGSESMFNALLQEKIKNDSPQMVALLNKRGYK